MTVSPKPPPIKAHDRRAQILEEHGLGHLAKDGNVLDAETHNTQKHRGPTGGKRIMEKPDSWSAVPARAFEMSEWAKGLRTGVHESIYYASDVETVKGSLEPGNVDRGDEGLAHGRAREHLLRLGHRDREGQFGARE